MMSPAARGGLPGRAAEGFADPAAEADAAADALAEAEAGGATSCATAGGWPPHDIDAAAAASARTAPAPRGLQAEGTVAERSGRRRRLGPGRARTRPC